MIRDLMQSSRLKNLIFTIAGSSIFLISFSYYFSYGRNRTISSPWGESMIFDEAFVTARPALENLDLPRHFDSPQPKAAFVRLSILFILEIDC